MMSPVRFESLTSRAVPHELHELAEADLELAGVVAERLQPACIRAT